VGGSVTPINGYPKAIAMTAVEEKPQTKTANFAPAITKEQELAEEYLSLHARYQDLEVYQLTKRMNEVRQALLAQIPEEMDPTTEVHYHCDSGCVTFAPACETIEVKKKLELMQHLVEKFDSDVLAGVVKFSLTDLKKVLSEAELKQFVESKLGTRHIKAVHKP
jgi:hypothetical protein